MRFPLLAGLTLSLAVCPPLGAQSLAPCPHPFTEAWECGSLRVPENRQTGQGRAIDLEVMVRRASGPDRREPLFLFSGGPGAPTATGARPNLWASQAATRDLVLLDQRGTGRSNGFICDPGIAERPQLAFGQLYPMDEVRTCYGRSAVESDPDRYTTADFADDVDAVREWLGYEKIVLSGGSYGTRSAMTYAALYPEHVAGAVLNGVIPPDERSPLSYARTAQSALNLVFEDCGAQPVCRDAFPNLEEGFTRLMAELRATPAEVTIRTRAGSPATVRMHAADLGYAVRIILYNRNLIPLLPRMLHDAATTGNLSALAEAHYNRAAGILSFASLGLHFSVFCAEDVPFIADEEIGPATDGTYFGRYFVEQYREGCRAWPVERRDHRSHELEPLNVPVLMLSGRYDPVTPPEFAERTRTYFPNSVHIVQGNGGHGAGGACINAVINAFLRHLDPAEVTQQCDAVRTAEFAVR